jgi:hypothetical protein
VHWGVGLNKKVVARFYYPKDSADLRLMVGEWLAVAGWGLWLWLAVRLVGWLPSGCPGVCQK